MTAHRCCWESPLNSWERDCYCDLQEKIKYSVSAGGLITDVLSKLFCFFFSKLTIDFTVSFTVSSSHTALGDGLERGGG